MALRWKWARKSDGEAAHSPLFAGQIDEISTHFDKLVQQLVNRCMIEHHPELVGPQPKRLTVISPWPPGTQASFIKSTIIANAGLAGTTAAPCA
jgi:hypothetical protein